MKISHDDWVVLADGRKAIFTQNVGPLFEPKLEVRRVLEAERNPANHEQGADRPGRVFEGSTGRRSAVGQTDWHDQAEAAFAKDVTEALAELHRKNKVPHLVLVAAPRALANLRAAMPAAVRSITVSEVDKDLTNHRLDKVEKILAGL